jgi:type II secretory ATPase GspE/PulE/Tfp pilus assembly ATPase PilB-like protein
MLTMIKEQFKDLPDEYKKNLPLDKPLHQAKASEAFPTGMKGRVPVFEVLTFTPEIQAAVLHSKAKKRYGRLLAQTA